MIVRLYWEGGIVIETTSPSSPAQKSEHILKTEKKKNGRTYLNVVGFQFHGQRAERGRGKKSPS